MLAIKSAVGNAKKVVLVGGSFIGSETAASLKSKFKDAVDITLVVSN
jgi:NADH dehydrogenase FAD-containing subunit